MQRKAPRRTRERTAPCDGLHKRAVRLDPLPFDREIAERAALEVLGDLG
jgi:hypothetical protein